MTLVERFIEIDGWSAARKTALLVVISAPFHVYSWLFGRAAARNTGAVDVAMFDILMAVWAVSLALIAAASIVEMRLRREGRWTAYLIVLLFSAWMAGYTYVAGLWTTPALAMFPIAVVTVTLFYGERRVGWFAFWVSLIVLSCIWFLQRSGQVPYAPILVDATDRLGAIEWGRVSGIGVLGFYIFCFLLSILAVSARRLQDERLRAAQKLIRRYVPSQLAERIFSGQHSDAFKPERARLTIFFSDVVGFTDASDELDAEDLAAILNEYLSEMSVIAEKHGATINQFVGDGIMIFFGAPHATSDQDHALRAVRMALEMQRRLVELQDIWVKRGIQKPFRARIGINTGHASVGDFGSRERKVYSAIGVQTNLAARIQAQCEPGKVLISHATWGLVREQFSCLEKGELQFKGIHYPVKVYEVSAA